MAVRRSRRWDYLPVAAAAMTGATAVGYLRLIYAQGDEPVAWVLAVLVVAVLLSLYGAIRANPLRKWALYVAGSVLVIMGIVGAFSIGFPLLVAGILALVAGAKSATAP